MIELRYEHPMHLVLNKPNESDQVENVIEKEPCKYPLNPVLVVKADGIHVGLNVNSVFKVCFFQKTIQINNSRLLNSLNQEKMYLNYHL